MISKWEIKKVWPDYIGGNICFGYNVGPIDIGPTRMHIYEAKMPIRVSVPVVLMYGGRNELDLLNLFNLKDVYLKKETVLNLIETLNVHKKLLEVATKTYDGLYPLLDK